MEIAVLSKHPIFTPVSHLHLTANTNMHAPSTLGEMIPCGGGDSIPLLKPKLLVGRRSHCDIQLLFPNVSSHHCELEYVNSFWRVQDLGSSNGIKVNGERTDTRWLMPGDVLSVGKHRYEIVYVVPDGMHPPEQDEDPFARSLMEKAGLERPRETPRRSTIPNPSSNATSVTPDKSLSRDDDDNAMDWLTDH